MKFDLVELAELSGPKCAVYSIWLEEEAYPRFDQFVVENNDLYRSEVDDIRATIEEIGSKYGAHDHFFKLHEGSSGDGVCALYDDPKSNLRLYCIRYGRAVLILGGGGHKPKTVRKLQEVDKLKNENYLLRNVSNWVSKAMQNGDIKFDGLEFSGQLTIDTEDL